MTGAARILGLIATVAILGGCVDLTGPSDSGDIAVGGTITMEGVPVSSAQVALSESRQSLIGGGGVSIFIDHTFTDSKGYYRVAKRNVECRDRSLIISFPAVLRQTIPLPDCGSFTMNVDLTRAVQ